MGAIEIKSGETITSDYFNSLNRITELVPEIFSKAVVYGGTVHQSRSTGDIVPFRDLCEVLESFEANQR